MKYNIHLILKILLILALLLCLFNMPYGYYQFVRFITAFIFFIFAYNYSKKQNSVLMIASVGIGILFQPFFKIALGREIWMMVDVFTAVFLIFLILLDFKEFKNQKKVFKNLFINVKSK